MEGNQNGNEQFAENLIRNPFCKVNPKANSTINPLSQRSQGGIPGTSAAAQGVIFISLASLANCLSSVQSGVFEISDEQRMWVSKYPTPFP